MANEEGRLVVRMTGVINTLDFESEEERNGFLIHMNVTMWESWRQALLTYRAAEHGRKVERAERERVAAQPST